MRSLTLAAFLSVPAVALPAAAAPITFETTPAGTVPVDNGSLTSPYSYSGGSVRFFFDTNGNNVFDAADAAPAFERASDNDTVDGFVSAVPGGHDNPRPAVAADFGSFFLRTPLGQTGGEVPGSFIAAYSTTTPIRALSGEIWDIDGGSGRTEQWQVDVLNAAGGVLRTQTSPLGTTQNADSLDSLPWTFQFANLPDGVAGVRLTFVGNKENNIGLAFNNFSPDAAVPEPGTLGLTLSAACAMLSRWRRR